MQIENELDYINKAKDGDIDAYGIIAESYNDMIYTLAMRILNNREEAEDLCQEILIKLFKTLHKYKAQAPFGAWVYRISYNETINKYRSLKRHRGVFEPTSEHTDVRAETSLVDDKMQHSERKMIILEALSSLSVQDKFLVHGFYFDDIPIKELAVITGLTESNIKIKLHRSRKKLFELLNKKHIIENLF